MHEESPFNSVPPTALALTALVALTELVLSAAANGFIGGVEGIGWRSVAFRDFAFAPVVMTEIFERGRGSLDLWQRFITYSFVHVSFTHALWASVLMLALGKFVGEALNAIPFLILFFTSSIGGAAIYGVISWENTPLLGAYPGIYGLIGAYTYLTWLRLGKLGENQLNAFRLIGVLMGLLVVYSVLFGATTTWIAEVAGFVIGMTISPLLTPGGWTAFIVRIRNRS